MTAALIFDFDGTIIDTETPVYESWTETFLRAGVEPVPIDVWKAQIGKADGDALDLRSLLCEGLGVDAVSADLDVMRSELRDEMMAKQPIRAGVTEWIEAAQAAGVPLAVASSSPTHWVQGNLERVGMRDLFVLLSCADPPTPGKPDPTVYLQACEQLGVDPEAALAIEDSANGTTAAIAAGMRCIAVPGPMTVGSDFSHATATADSLADFDPADWLH